MRTRRPRGCRDAGAAALEYTGMIMVAALVVGAVMAGVVSAGPTIESGAARALCTILTLGQGDCGSQALADPRVPTTPCVTSQNNVSQDMSATIVILHLGGGQDYEYATLSDGRVRITRLDTAAVGVEGGAGVGLTATGWGRTVGGSAVVQGSADVTLRAGQTWYLDDADQARDFFNEVKHEGTKDLVLGPAGLKRTVADVAEGLLDKVRGKQPPEIGPPDERYFEGGVVLSASAEALAGGGGTAGFEGSEALGYRQGADGTTTIYLHTTAQAQVALQLVGADASDPLPASVGAGDGVDLITAVSFDRSNQMTEVRTTLDLAGGGSTSVADAAEQFADPDGNGVQDGDRVTYEASLPTGTARDRRTALRYLAATGVAHLAVDTANLDLAIDKGPFIKDAVRDYTSAVLDHGQLTRQTFKDDPSKAKEFGATLNATLGGGLGLGGGYSSSEQASGTADYWDGRSWTPWKGCAA